MSQFTTALRVMPYAETMDPMDRPRNESADVYRFWVVLEPFEYHAGAYPSTEVYRVPRGFLTDFASVPRALWPVFPPWGKHGKAAVLHDLFYATQTITRRRADELFLEAMRVLGVAALKRWLMYQGVRIFGGAAWRRNQRRTFPVFVEV